MTEPPMPPRQAVKPQRRKLGAPLKIINGVVVHGLKNKKEPPPPTAKHALTPHEGPNK